MVVTVATRARRMAIVLVVRVVVAVRYGAMVVGVSVAVFVVSMSVRSPLGQAEASQA